MDSWEDESFRINADGQTVYAKSFKHDDSFGSKVCGAATLDHIEYVSVRFAHSKEEIHLELTSDLN
jgi:hypothetical protein